MRPSSQAKGKTSRRTSGMGGVPLRGIHINISSDPFQHRIPPHLQRLWQESKTRQWLSKIRTRLVQRYRVASQLEMVALIVAVFLGGVFLLVHVGFFSGKKYQDWHHDHYGWLDEVDLLDHLYPDQGQAQTTAVLLFDPRDRWKIANEANETLSPVLEQLCAYNMFGAVLVWNNNPLVNVTQDVIYAPGCPANKVQIYNSPSHMHNAGRYLACSLATTPYCYFQNVAGDRHLRSLYANFLRSPHLLHVQSRDPFAFSQTRWKWCFFNEDVDMHACHAQVEYGAFISKESANKFIQLMELDPIDVTYSDAYFALSMNQVPYQLEGYPDSFKEADGKEEVEFQLDPYRDQRNPNMSVLERQHLHGATISLYQHLKRNTGLIPKDQVLPTIEQRHAKVPCENDRCLFLTNVDTFPDLKLFRYSPSIDVETSEKLHEDYFDSEERYLTNPYANAVDEDDDTVWKSAENIKKGDFIGFDLLLPIRISLNYRFLVRHPYYYRKTLNLQISYDGTTWVDAQPGYTMNCDAATDDTHTPLLECQFSLQETGFRFIRLQSTQDLDFPFQVHDLSFSARAKRDANGQLLDLGVDDAGIAFVEDITQ